MILTSDADVDAAFPANDAPQAVMDVDFTVDRVVLGSSNPAIQFAVDDGAQLVVGEESFCQGVPPQCIAYIVRGTTRNVLTIDNCPYTGPDPCLAP